MPPAEELKVKTNFQPGNPKGFTAEGVLKGQDDEALAE
jgi:hypothetical protein